jgi:F0F1-type ATP synthase membrane subunit b/b'
MLIRVAIFLAIVFGVAYGLTRAAKTAQHRRLLAEIDDAKKKLAALRAALSEGELSQREHDELAEQVYARCRDKGLPIDDENESTARMEGTR